MKSPPLGEWCERADGTKHGPFTSRWPSGKLSALGTYDNGEKSDHWTIYWPSGEKQESGQFEADQRIGSWTYWHQSGEIAATGSFLSGKRDGVWSEWTSGPEPIRSDITYRLGEKHGPYSELWPSGAQRAVGQYELGKKIGVWKSMDASSSPVAEHRYQNGKLDGLAKYWKDNHFESASCYQAGARRWSVQSENELAERACP